MKTYESALLALADPTRRAIIGALHQAPRSVGDVVKELPISQPAVSQHLKVLSAAQLVKYQRVGTRHVYSLDPEGLIELRGYLESFWDGVLEAYAGSLNSEGPSQ